MGPTFDFVENSVTFPSQKLRPENGRSLAGLANPEIVSFFTVKHCTDLMGMSRKTLGEEFYPQDGLVRMSKLPPELGMFRRRPKEVFKMEFILQNLMNFLLFGGLRTKSLILVEIHAIFHKMARIFLDY